MRVREIEQDVAQICENLKLLRQKKSIRTRELSTASGVSEYMIKSFENGVLPKRASVTHLLNLCTYFDIHICRIFAPLEK